MVVQNGSLDAVYLADRTDPERFALLKRLRAAALATPGVVEALYREPNPTDGDTANTVDGAHPGWHAAGERSGDLLVTHASGGAFSDPSIDLEPAAGQPRRPADARQLHRGHRRRRATCVQQRVAGTAGPLFDDTLDNPQQAENVDPAPTIMGLLGLAPPRDSDGRFLTEAFDLTALPGRGAPAVTPKLRVKRLSCRRLRVTIRPRTGRHDLRVGKKQVLQRQRPLARAGEGEAADARCGCAPSLRSASGAAGPGRQAHRPRRGAAARR